MRISRQSFLQTSLALALTWLFAGAVDARAQAVIKVNDDVNFKFGVLGQFQGTGSRSPRPTTPHRTCSSAGSV